MLALQASRARPNLRRRKSRRIVDVNRRLRHELHRRVDSRPVFIREITGPEVRHIDPAQRGDHAKRQLLRRHFHGKYGDAFAGTDRGIFADIDRQRRLAHRRSARNDDEIAALQAGGHLVEFVKAARNAGDAAVGLVQLIDAIDGLRQDVLESLETLAAAASLLGDIENQPFGSIEDLCRRAPVAGKRTAADFITRVDQGAQRRTLPDDLRIGAGISRARRFVSQRRQIL